MGLVFGRGFGAAPPGRFAERVFRLNFAALPRRFRAGFATRFAPN
jgi:hypothetical protein